jgi:hypothetical protein
LITHVVADAKAATLEGRRAPLLKDLDEEFWILQRLQHFHEAHALNKLEDALEFLPSEVESS